MKRSRHTLPKLLVTVAVLCGLAAADSTLRLVTTEYPLAFPDLPEGFDGFRIVQLSDVHGAVFGRDNCRLLEQTAALCHEKGVRLFLADPGDGGQSGGFHRFPSPCIHTGEGEAVHFLLDPV